MRILQALLLSLMLVIGSAGSLFAVVRHPAKKTTTNASKSSVRTVKGYTKKNGTHVQTHKRTAPNSTAKDNFSTKGSVNPYTGKKGTKTAQK
jgi:hypothetical protein